MDKPGKTGKAFCEPPFTLQHQQPEKDKQNVTFAPPGKNSANAHADTCILFNVQLLSCFILVFILRSFLYTSIEFIILTTKTDFLHRASMF